VNKGFEVVETHFFFKVPYENIGVVVHRESLVHALVECKDNALFACIYPTDMRIPIAYAMHYPVRKQYLSGIDFAKKFSLSFQPLDYDKFPLLKIVREAAVKGGNSLAVINACDEVVVESFLNKEIKFTDIHKVMEHIWYKCPYSKTKNVDDIFYWDNWARAKTLEYIKKVTKD
jgi:1-deoxy-D-xylulose-5-phosphate reductoisomerase